MDYNYKSSTFSETLKGASLQGASLYSHSYQGGWIFPTKREPGGLPFGSSPTGKVYKDPIKNKHDAGLLCKKGICKGGEGGRV
jgi:hypothetical protein